MALPVLSLDEKKEALQKAQQMRKKRSELRNALKKGEISLADVLFSDDEVTSRMRVSYLLRSLPRIGKVKAQKIMQEIGIDEARRIQGLGKRQKEALIARFSNR